MKPKYNPLSQIVDPPWVLKEKWEQRKSEKTNKTQTPGVSPQAPANIGKTSPPMPVIASPIGEQAAPAPIDKLQGPTKIDKVGDSFDENQQGTGEVNDKADMNTTTDERTSIEAPVAPLSNSHSHADAPRLLSPQARSNGPFVPNANFSSGGGPRPMLRGGRSDPRTAAQARAELEALFSSETAPVSNSPSTQFPVRTLVVPKQGGPANLTAPVEVIVKRKRMGADALAPETGNLGSSAAEEESKETSDRTTGSEGSSRTFLLPSSKMEPAATQEKSNSDQDDLFSSLALVKEGKIPANVKPVEEHIDAKSVRARLEFMSPDQALAWLLLTPEQDLKPISLEESRQLIAQNLKKIDFETIHALRPVSHWISEPSSQILRYSDGQLRRAPQADAAINLPGQLGVWISANKLLSAETVKRSVNAQRINEISLAGLLIASNRFEAMEWMVADGLSPIRPAALLGCSPEFQETGHEIGAINGYALAMLAQSSQFFNWAMQWQPVLEESQQGKGHELSGALALAIKIWSGAHGDLNQACAEMTAIMLQLGASISEWSLQAFSHGGRKSTTAAVAWSRLCAQTFAIDRQGKSVQRVIDSARANGFNLMPKAGEPQAITPYVQANLYEAVAVFLRNGFPVDVPDAVGQTAVSRARSARSSRVMSLIDAYLKGAEIGRELQEDMEFDRQMRLSSPSQASTSLQDLLIQEDILRGLLKSMSETSKNVRELDAWLGFDEVSVEQRS